MAKEIENININGEAYEVGKIYSKMGLSFERFVELLGRDFYCPVLASDPTTTTTIYTDTDGSGNEFQQGQFALVADAASEGGYKVWQCLSNNGTAAVWKLWDSASGEASSSQPMVSTTWAELKAMRDGATLVPGTWYRITDYMTTTSQEGTQSAGHQFDVVVLATGTNTLSEEARAAKHEGDTYFTENGANLDAWKIWYCLDNDKLRFPWAVVRTEKSIVVQMDESTTLTADYVGIYEHEGVTYHRWNAFYQGYTFLFLTESDNPQAGNTILYYGIVELGIVTEFGGAILSVKEATDNEGYGVIYRMVDENHNDVAYDFKNVQFMRDDAFMYTFHLFNQETGIHSDFSFNGFCFSNTIPRSVSGLNDIVMINTDSLRPSCYSNTFGDSCYSNTFGNSCYSNTFGDGCYSNTFGDGCDSNTFGGYCYSNTFGDGCGSNTFGDRCYSNTFGDSCDSNTFEDSCYSNAFGIGCSSNAFGDRCNSNTFEDICNSNTFGISCNSNTFGDRCNSNTFGDSCYSNTFGDSCNSNTFGDSCDSNTFGDSCDSNTFGDGCSNIKFGEPLKSSITRYKLSGNIRGQVLPVEANRTYETKVAYNSKGELKIYCEADLIN